MTHNFARLATSAFSRLADSRGKNCGSIDRSSQLRTVVTASVRHSLEFMRQYTLAPGQNQGSTLAEEAEAVDEALYADNLVRVSACVPHLPPQPFQ